MSALLRATLVCCVLGVCDPSAVFGRVVSVNVDAVDLGRREIPGTHVRDKVNGGSPAIADFDPSRAVAIEPVGLGAVAPMHHGDPLPINGISVQAVFGGHFPLEASAALDASAFELVDANYVREKSADASTDRRVAIGACLFDNPFYGKPAENLAYMDAVGGIGLKPEFGKIHGAINPLLVMGQLYGIWS